MSIPYNNKLSDQNPNLKPYSAFAAIQGLEKCRGMQNKNIKQNCQFDLELQKLPICFQSNAMERLLSCQLQKSEPPFFNQNEQERGIGQNIIPKNDYPEPSWLNYQFSNPNDVDLKNQYDFYEQNEEGPIQNPDHHDFEDQAENSFALCQNDREKDDTLNHQNRKGKWTEQEDRIYLQFLLQNRSKITSKSTRKNQKIYRQLSEALNRSRTPKQCRMHHLRMKKNTRSIKTIVDFLGKKHNGQGTNNHHNGNQKAQYPQIQNCNQKSRKEKLKNFDASAIQGNYQTKGKTFNFANNFQGCIQPLQFFKNVAFQEYNNFQVSPYGYMAQQGFIHSSMPNPLQAFPLTYTFNQHTEFCKKTFDEMNLRTATGTTNSKQDTQLKQVNVGSRDLQQQQRGQFYPWRDYRQKYFDTDKESTYRVSIMENCTKARELNKGSKSEDPQFADQMQVRMQINLDLVCPW